MKVTFINSKTAETLLEISATTIDLNPFLTGDIITIPDRDINVRITERRFILNDDLTVRESYIVGDNI